MIIVKIFLRKKNFLGFTIVAPMNESLLSWNISSCPKTEPLIGEVWPEYWTRLANCYQCDARTLRISLSSFSYFRLSRLSTSTFSIIRDLRPEQILSKIEEKERKNRKVKNTLHRNFEDLENQLLIGKFFKTKNQIFDFNWFQRKKF